MNPHLCWDMYILSEYLEQFLCKLNKLCCYSSSVGDEENTATTEEAERTLTL